MVHIFERINDGVARSFVGRWFKLEGSGVPGERTGSRFLTEIRAGLTTWASMAYIISVNASILSDSGGPCVCPEGADCTGTNNDVYMMCVNEVRQNLITSTAAISALSSFFMGLLANLPVGLAPGLGLNAYVSSYLWHMTTQRHSSYGERWVFMFLSIIGLRQWLVRIMPQSLVLAVGAGIGLFIAYVPPPNGLGVLGGDKVNLIGLGGCLEENFYDGLENFCERGVLRNPRMWIGIFLGGVLTVLMMMYRVRGAILIGIFIVSKVVTFQKLDKVGNALDYGSYRKGRVWYALITFLYVDILDTTGTLYSMAKFAGLRNPVSLDFENSSIAYCVDAFCISMGALMGTSPVTAYVESATGISEGGKTGLTAMTTGFAFFISVFFAPIFASIPSWATGGALVIVGSLMIRNVLEINWHYIGDAVPAFLTLVIIPLSYNIAYGVIAGVISYVILNGIPLAVRKMTNDRVLPANYELSEEWIIPEGSIIPYWIRKLMGRTSPNEGIMPDEKNQTNSQTASDLDKTASLEKEPARVREGSS
ncbi:xanthine/uracil permease [Cyathus striatus]|nr:xanthine/uracil permease [Cyathus striatus]